MEFQMARVDYKNIRNYERAVNKLSDNTVNEYENCQFSNHAAGNRLCTRKRNVSLKK